MMVRSGLALETSPARSAVITFAILAALGWPACARAVFRGTQHLRLSGSMLYGPSRRPYPHPARSACTFSPT